METPLNLQLDERRRIESNQTTHAYAPTDRRIHMQICVEDRAKAEDPSHAGYRH